MASRVELLEWRARLYAEGLHWGAIRPSLAQGLPWARTYELLISRGFMAPTPGVEPGTS
jgi:hypothetical protein